MILGLTIAYFAILLPFQICHAAGPLVVPNIISPASTGPVALFPASAHLPNTSFAPDLLSNFTSLIGNSPFGITKPKPRPKDPEQFAIPGTSLSLEFSDYAEGVQAGETLLLFLKGLLTAFDKILAAGRDVPLTQDETFEERSVYMIVYGGRYMTYSILRSAIGGVVGFMIEYGTFGVNVKITRDSQMISTIFIGRI